MPDKDRKPAFIDTLSKDSGDGSTQCTSCRGTGVTFQADCVCCGREVIVSHQAPNGPWKFEDSTNSVQALGIKTEVVPDELRSSRPESVIPSFAQESKPVIIPVPAGLGPSTNERQRRSNILTLRSFNHSERPGVGTRGGRYGSLNLLQHPTSDSRSAVRMYQQPQCNVGHRSRRGSSRCSSGAGAHPPFKGVRTRKGVKGFLVEIRPPKWKKTIWLGTYSTSVEAAGAYDAGVFYTKKANTKYNFPTSEGTFPPLPAHLRLDTADSWDEIKLFVQNEAHAAASRMGNAMRTGQLAVQQEAQIITSAQNNPAVTNSNSGQPTSSGSCLTSSHDYVNADLQTTTNSSSSEVIVEIESEFQIPMDFSYFGQRLQDETAAAEAATDMFLDYTNYKSQQGARGPDQELLSEEDV